MKQLLILILITLSVNAGAQVTTTQLNNAIANAVSPLKTRLTAAEGKIKAIETTLANSRTDTLWLKSPLVLTGKTVTVDMRKYDSLLNVANSRLLIIDKLKAICE